MTVLSLTSKNATKALAQGLTLSKQPPSPHSPSSFLTLPTRFFVALGASGDLTVLQRGTQKLNVSPNPSQPCHLHLLFIGDLTFLQHILLFRVLHSYYFVCTFEKDRAGFTVFIVSFSKVTKKSLQKLGPILDFSLRLIWIFWKPVQNKIPQTTRESPSI